MGKSWLGRVLLTIGLFWGAIGFLFWASSVSSVTNFFAPEVIQSLIFYVIGPALFFIFASIVSAITDVYSNA